MATLNITTNKTRAQMVTELTNWADATKVSGNDYVWACADDITVTSEIELYGFTLIFASEKTIVANAGGNIKVSETKLTAYIFPTKIMLNGANLSNIDLVSGTGKWTGKALTININGASVRFNSATSQTDLVDFSIDALDSAFTLRTNLKINLSVGSINLYRVTGTAVIRENGNVSMNPRGIGLVTGERRGPAKILSNLTTFPGFIILSDASNITQTSSVNFVATTLTFKDGNVNPLFMGIYPKGNATAIRKIERTITFQPKKTDGTDISAFNYRISSNRVLEPASTTTPNTQIIVESNKAYGYKYVMTVWNGNTGEGSGTYGVALNQIIDKDMKVQYRKYGLEEATFSSNSYNFAVDAPAIMSIDRFVSTNPVIFNTYVNASQFYDSIRNGCANYLDIPEDIIITDGKTLTIKTGWTLKRSATATSSIIHVAPKEIVIDKDSYIGKMDTGIFKFDTIAGTVDATMAGHTNMNYTKTDGSANLQLSITCPDGSKDPVAGVWLFSQGLDNRAGMITGMASGTGIKNITLSVSATTKYYCTVKALGSNQYKPFIIEPVGGLGGSKEITLFVYEKNDGTPLLPDTLTPAQTAVAATLEFHTTHIDVKIPTDFATNPRWSSTDKIWQYKADDFIALAYKLDVIQTALILLGKNQLIFLQEGRILVSATANEKILEQDPDNKTTVSSTTNVKVSFTTISIGRVGDTDARNTFIDDVNGTIDVRGGVPINGGFSASDASRLVAVKTETDKIPAIQTKADETHQRLALDSTKPLTSKPDGGITSTGIAITATELADGSVVQTRGT